MEGGKSSSAIIPHTPHVKVKLYPPKKLIKKIKNQENLIKLKLSALKAKIYFAQMKKMRSSPEINKTSREIINYSKRSTEPKSKYIKKILSNKNLTKSISNKSLATCTSTCSSPGFLMFSNDISRETNSTNSQKFEQNGDINDIFSRNIALARKKEAALEEKRKERYHSELRECTFTPKLIIKKSNKDRSRSKSVKSNDSSFTREKSPIMSYKSLSPSPSRYGYTAGCNLIPIREKARPMFKYLAVKMSYL